MYETVEVSVGQTQTLAYTVTFTEPQNIMANMGVNNI